MDRGELKNRRGTLRLVDSCRETIVNIGTGGNNGENYRYKRELRQRGGT